MARPVAVITDVTDLDPQPGIELLTDAGFDVHVLAWDRDRTVPEPARGAVAALVGYARLDDEFFRAFPSIRWVGTASTGTDMIDPDAAAAHGVTVQPLVGASTEEVATHALALILAVERDLRGATAVAARGEWTDAFRAMPRRMSQLTLGLCGLGRIGTRVAELARPLFGRIAAYDPYAPGSDAVDEMVGFDELLQRADVLSLHLPLTAQTRAMIDAEALAKLPAGASVVNCSRGELIDEQALIAALDDGRLRGAGLDVLAGEPPAADDPLRTHPCAVVTPHVAFLSDGSLATYEQQPARNLLAWWERQRP